MELVKPFEIALSQYGICEWPGESHNPEVVKYFRECNFKVQDDETSWCSVFVCWCMKQANVPHTNSLSARSWANWGVKIYEPQLGDIAVFNRPPISWQGHVGFYVRNDGNRVWVLGGNQNNSVNISSYSGVHLIGYRRWQP